MRLVMEVNRSPEGRLEGRINSDARAEPAEFSGILELLKVLEDLSVSPNPQGLR